MIKFELTFKNKPVKLNINEKGDAALYFDNGDWLLLGSTDNRDKYTIADGSFSPAKEDLALLGKLINIGMKEYEKLHSFSS